MLTGIGMLVPVIMIYNGYVYLVFRGKIADESSYKEPGA
jgi:cytochrome bd-type quinol oxidase subunit 2